MENESGFGTTKTTSFYELSIEKAKLGSGVIGEVLFGFLFRKFVAFSKLSPAEIYTFKFVELITFTPRTPPGSTYRKGF